MKTKTTRTKRQISPSSSPQQQPSWLVWALFLVAMAGSFHEFVIKKADGSYELREERRRKLDREINDLKEPAIQYALITREDGYYPCFNCGAKTMIFLKAGEVWKYGFTTMKKRYSSSFLDNALLNLVPQYEGTETDCKIEEKKKIYAYPLLPENLARSFKLPRPPGNKQDN